MADSISASNLKETECPVYNQAVLHAVVSWIAFEDPVKIKQIISEWLSCKKTSCEWIYQLNLTQPLNTLLTLATESKDDVTTVDEHDQTILHLWLQCLSDLSQRTSKQIKNDVVFIKTLCEMGASVISEDECEDTPLGIALENKRMDIVDAMVRFNTANVTDCNSDGDTILHVLLFKYTHDEMDDYKKFLDIVESVLSKGADINKFNHGGLAPVHMTVYDFLPDLLEKLESFGFDLHYRTEIGDDLLMLLCKYTTHSKPANLDKILWLLNRRFNVHSKNYHDFTPLHYAAKSNDLNLVKCLMQYGADVHALSKDGTNPLHIATQYAAHSATIYLIEQGVSFNRQNILHGAILLLKLIVHTTNIEDAYTWLINRVFNQNQEGNVTLLHIAAMLGYEKLVKIFIRSGADVHAKDGTFQFTPLHLASIRREFTIVPELREMGFFLGSIGNDSAELAFWVNERCEITLKDKHQEIDYEATVIALLNAGANVNAKGRSGRTPLHYVAQLRYESNFILPLVEAGAHVDELDFGSLSPLHNSLLNGNDNALLHLLSFGADINDIEHPYRNICGRIRQINSPFSFVGIYLMKLFIANLPINSLYKPYLDFEKRRENYVEYFKELEELKNYLLPCNTSVYDWMHMNSNRQCTLLDNMPCNVVDDSKYYGAVIENLACQAIIRKSFLEPAKTAFLFLTGWRWPDLCIEHIFLFLNNRDLRLMIDSSKIDTGH